MGAAILWPKSSVVVSLAVVSTSILGTMRHLPEYQRMSSLYEPGRTYRSNADWVSFAQHSIHSFLTSSIHPLDWLCVSTIPRHCSSRTANLLY